MANYLDVAVDAYASDSSAENLARVLSELVASGVYVAREGGEGEYAAVVEAIEAAGEESAEAAILLGFTSEAAVKEALGKDAAPVWLAGERLAAVMEAHGYVALAVNPGPQSFLAAAAQVAIAAPSPATHALVKAQIDVGNEQELGAALIDAPLHIAARSGSSDHAYGRGHDGHEAILAFTCPAEAWALDSAIEAAEASFAHVLGHAVRQGVGIIVNPATRRFDIPAARVAELADGITGLASE